MGVIRSPLKIPGMILQVVDDTLGVSPLAFHLSVPGTPTTRRHCVQPHHHHGWAVEGPLGSLSQVKKGNWNPRVYMHIYIYIYIICSTQIDFGYCWDYFFWEDTLLQPPPQLGITNLKHLGNLVVDFTHSNIYIGEALKICNTWT